MSWQQPEQQQPQPQGQGWGAPQQPQAPQWGAGPQGQAPQQPGQVPPYGAAPDQGQVPQFGAQPQPGQAPQFGAPQPGQAAPPPFYTPHPYEKKRSGFGTRQIVSLVVVVLAIGGYFVYNHLHNVQRNSNGNITKAGSMSVFDLKVGDCFSGASAGDDDLSSVTGVPCTQAHSGQVLGTVQMTDASYPADSDLQTEANNDCQTFWNALPSSLPSDANGAYLYPDENSFNAGTKTISCVVQSDTSDLTSSYASGS